MLNTFAIQRLRQQCQMALLTLGAVGLLTLPVMAQDGILRATDPQAQINLRSSPDPNARRLGYGLVGDRVEIIEQVPGSDDYTWYRVRFYQSGAIGWIRGDFIEVVTGSGQTGSGQTGSQIRYQEGYDQGYQLGYRDGQNARRYNAGFHPDKFIQAGSGSRDPEYDRGFRAGFFAGFDLGYNSTPTTTTPAPTDGTLLAFQTAANAVRIYNRAGQTYMNIFDKQQGRTWLNGVSVAVEQSRTGTSYRYRGEPTVVVFQSRDGSRTLNINGQVEEGY
jgi:Bacterial SH3 domain